MSDAVSDFTPAVSSFPLSWLKYFPIWLAWKPHWKRDTPRLKTASESQTDIVPFKPTHNPILSLSPNSCPTLQSAAVWTDTHLAKVNMVFSSYTHTDTIMGNPMVGQTSLTLVKAKTHVLMSIDFPLFHSPVLHKCLKQIKLTDTFSYSSLTWSVFQDYFSNNRQFTVHYPLQNSKI